MKFGIIPQPQYFSVDGEKTVFTLTDLVRLEAGEGCENAAKDLRAFISKVLSPDAFGTGEEKIQINIDKNGKKESYRLSVSENLVAIDAADEAGAFYAVQSLKQLLLQSGGNLPALFIDDYPACEYRGFMLDASRYFFTVDAVKLFLDAMALHKLNCFHWHLTDDQGWRVELYGHLLLAQVGGFRAYTNFGRTPHGGFYSKEDIAEIVAYAHERYIKVIPEIDSPGHVVSAIAAYPFLSCFNRELPVATHSGVKHDVFCVGKESTFEFMFSVFDEIIEMFPDKIIHLGGDEVPVTRWKICPHCQERMKQLGLTDEAQLHAYYINRLADYLDSKGIKMMMWHDGRCENKYNEKIIFQFWGTGNLPVSLADKTNVSRLIVNSRSDACYLDLPYGTINLRQTYEADFSNAYENSNIIGAEACLWTEYVPTMKKAGYCTFPRLGAFCENVWTEKENRNYQEFTEKLPAYERLLDTLPFDHASLRQAMPSFIRKYGYLLYFERRKLHWQGLHIIIDNRKVERLSEKNQTPT